MAFIACIYHLKVYGYNTLKAINLQIVKHFFTKRRWQWNNSSSDCHL